MKLLVSVISGVVLGVAGVAGVAHSPLAAAADAPRKGAAASPPAAVSAGVPTFALEPDGVTFGMNAEGVARLYDAWWDKQFVPKYRKANPGPRTRELDYELAEKKKVLRRVTTFDGRSSFDKSDFSEEFAHGTGESMSTAKLFRRLSPPAGAAFAATPPAPLASASPAGAGATSPKAVSYTRRLFFFQDRLWKIYDEYLLEPQGPLGADFKEATARVEASLGTGTKRTRGPESKWENVVFENAASRVRVVKLPTNHIAVVRSDNALAREVLDKRSHQVQATDEKLDADIQAVIR